ncbi:NAD(P)H-dependent flavin oxidoreductase [Virgibacillus pantothenticus]|uniref:NAD(P)H-dependent flavin oxidoreductase n=1 Tax=Virgibacillus pantothenticus TaxID=1473 RepID=UPI000986CC36|nr:nitronate monooxygenase [Virgibacillus pantothenticus]
MNRFLKLTKVKLPIIQAGMAGGITTPELVAAVANQGALGTIGAGYMKPEALQKVVQQVKQLTDQPFAVNLFATNLQASSDDLEPMQSELNTFRERLRIEPGSKQVQVHDYMQENLEVLLTEKVPIISTAFGILANEHIEKLKNNHVILIGMATNVEEAKQLEEAGYDIVVAQGSEAGGHRGTFYIDQYPDGCNIGLVSLLCAITEQVNIPVVATGGIICKEQMEGLLKLGAEAVQIGTRFLVAEEAGTAPSYKEAILNAKAEDTVITTFFSGRPARGIVNTFINELEQKQMTALPFPIQNDCTKDIRKAAKEQGDSAYQSLWAGQGVGQIRTEATVKDIIESFIK